MEKPLLLDLVIQQVLLAVVLHVAHHRISAGEDFHRCWACLCCIEKGLQGGCIDLVLQVRDLVALTAKTKKIIIRHRNHCVSYVNAATP